MLEKKLFTLACVLAILGIGACFVPPPQPTTVPLPPALTGTRVLAIDVLDASPTDPLQGTKLTKLTAFQFIQQWSVRHIRVIPQGSRDLADATLHITILKKQATPYQTQDRREAWKVALFTQMELVGKDHRQLWLRNESPITFLTWSSKAAPPPSLRSSGVMQLTAYNLALRAGNVVQNPNSFSAPPEQP